MLIDDYLKDYHFSEFHSIRVKGIPEEIYPLLLITEINSPLIKTLFRLRGVPFYGALKDIDKAGFVKLGENVNEEILFGIISTTGSFSQCRTAFHPEEFKKLSTPDHIKAVINFRTTASDIGETTISTETRVLCTGKKIKKVFRIYWLFVAPFSKLIRQAMLKEIKRKTEK
jgi:hypothetical protein